MDGQLLTELESAAQILLASPAVVTVDQRKSAENLFLNFRKTKSPYDLCRHILETSSVDFVQFEAASLLKDALIREWSFLGDSHVISLQQYLLQYIIQKQLPASVRERILQVIAIMVKRASVDDFGISRGHLLAEVEQLILSGDPPRRIIGCNIISSLIQEYSNTVKSSDVGLPWETHFKAKKQFEVTHLKRIFQFCVQALSEMTKDEVSLTVEMLNLLKHLVCLTESILTWGFINHHLPKRLIGVFESVYESDQNPALRLGHNWKDTILDPRVVNLFFKIHWRVRTNPELSHHTVTCLVQLASLSGHVIVNDKEIRIQYLTNYIKNFLHLVTSVNILDREALGISNIVRKMILFFPTSILICLPSELLQSFLEQLAKLTCQFAEGAAQEESVCADDCLYMEAFDHMLEAWISVLHNSQEFPKDFCKQSAMQIFNTYLKCHLSPPDGTRGQGRELDVEEIDDTEENDRTKFQDQLMTIGVVGRHVPGHSLTILCKLLEERTRRLYGQLQRLHSQAMNISDNSILDCLFEDIHWLVLIAGHVVSMDSQGEAASIPSEIMQYSIQQGASGQVNVQTTLKLLASPACHLPDVPGAEESSDHLVRLVAAVFRLCEVERRAVDVNLIHLLSPEVGSTLMWFLRRWSLSYLLPVERLYSEMSMALLTAFGKDTEGALWTMNFLLGKIESNLRSFYCETGLIKDTIQLLIALCDMKEKGSCVVKSDCLLNIIKLQSTMEQGALPQVAKRGLFKALVLVGSAVESQARADYWAQILKPLQDRFKSLICQENFTKLLHEEKVKMEIIDILESFIGVSQGSQISTVQSLFQFLYPMLSEFSTLIGMYHNYQVVVELILELYCECARNMLCYLSQTDSHRIYGACLQTIQTYARCNMGRICVESSSEENSYHDILLLMELLTNLLNKDCIDLGPPEELTEGEITVTAADVCLYGLDIIMPLMTIELLTFPSLCLQYFKMITFACEIYPDKVCKLPLNLLKSLLMSLELGLTSFGQDVIILCCDFIQVMGTHIYLYNIRDLPVHDLLQPFLKLLMDLMLTRQINSEILPNCSGALYILISVYQDMYQQLVRSLLDSQHDPVIAARLAKAFTDLTANIALDTNRMQRNKFRDNFDKFIATVRSFLVVK